MQLRDTHREKAQSNKTIQSLQKVGIGTFWSLPNEINSLQERGF